MSALLLPEYLELDLEWEARHEPTVLMYVKALNPEALMAWRSVAPWIKRLASKTTEQAYFGNSCASCGALQGDHFLHKPDAPFFPTTDELMSELRLVWFDISLATEAGVSMSSWMDRLIEREAGANF